MNKSVIIFLFALCLTCVQAQAQRYLPRQKGLQVSTGTVNSVNFNKGFHAGAAFSSYTKSGNRWLVGGEYLEKRYSYNNLKLPQSQFTAEGGYYWNFLSDGSKTFFFSLGASFLAGYETINWNKDVLPDGATLQHKDAFICGGTLTLEMETFLTDWLILLVNVRERVTGGSSVGTFNTQIGTGIKCIIN